VGINIEMTGSGELGPLAPGWSVQEYATPVTIGETAGGTGNVTFNAAAREDSLFVVNNNITTTEETLGSISGVVKSVSQTGLNVSVTHDTPLAIFDATKNIPALGAGGIYSALDLCNQLSGRQNLIKDYIDEFSIATPRTGRFYTLGGHSAGFNFNGELVEAETVNGTYTDYNPNDGKFYLSYYRQQYGIIWASTFQVLNNKVWATKVTGDAFSNSPGEPTSRIAFKVLLDGENFSWGFSGLPDDSNTGTGQTIGFSIDYASNSFSIGGDYRDGGMLSSFGQTYDMGTLLDKDSELAVFIEYTRPYGTTDDFVYKVTVCNTSDYSVTGELVQTIVGSVPSIFNSNWGMTGNVRSIYREQGKDLGDWIAEYELDETYIITGDIVIDGPVAAQNGTNMWEYLQQACSAYGYELSVVNDMIVVRTIGSNIIPIDNSTVPTIAPNMTLTGRNIEVSFTNATSIVDIEIYNAYNDNNRVLSVKADEQVTTTLEVSGTPAIVNLPVPSKSAVSGVGEYALCESDGSPIPYDLWSDAGGRVDVMINPDNPNAIDVVLTGPSSSWVAPGGGTPFGGTTPLYAGPYKIAYSSGGTDYAALSITATGVKTKPQVLKIRTAADDLKVAQDIAKSINNPFIATKQMAYDRGEWAIVEASGPKVTISASIPVSAVAGFGLVAGSLIYYRDSIYRVTDATIGNLAVSFSATRHVTVEDFDNLWDGKTVATHDLMWAGYDTADQVIAPLRFVGDNESVLMFLDTDVNPYYDFDGEPEISVFPDTDMNPYYEEGGNLEGEDPVYLDVDENPYDGGDGYGS
jgi:hypothetical protein